MKRLTIPKYSWIALILLSSASSLDAQTPAPVLPAAPPLPAATYTAPFPLQTAEPVQFPSFEPWTRYAEPSLFYVQKNSALVGGDILNALQVAPGVWWNDENMIARLGLTADQRRKMDDILQQFRLQLIDLNAALDKEELVLQPLVAAATLDQAKILAQIDRVAAARAELEKANARLLLGLQQTLTAEQRAKLPRNQPGTRKARIFQ
jgi:Spy/CpxP family protein refolding chaperone